MKGYSDTHARGSSQFDIPCQAATLQKGRPDAAADMAALRAAALAEPQDGQLVQRWGLLFGLGLGLGEMLSIMRICGNTLSSTTFLFLCGRNDDI